MIVKCKCGLVIDSHSTIYLVDGIMGNIIAQAKIENNRLKYFNKSSRKTVYHPDYIFACPECRTWLAFNEKQALSLLQGEITQEDLKEISNHLIRAFDIEGRDFWE